MENFKDLSFEMMCSMAGVACYGFMSRSLSVEKICDFAGVSKRTAERWLSGGNVPYSVIKLLELKHNSGIPQDGEWKGYYINRNEQLVSPEGHIVTPTKVRTMYLDKWKLEASTARINELERNITELKEEIKTLKSLGMEAKRKELIRLANEITELAGESTIRMVG